MINWGIVGAGDWLVKYHMPVLMRLVDEKKILLRGIWNRTNEKSTRLARQFGIPQVYDSFEDLLRDESLDCLTVVLNKTVSALHLKRIIDSGIPFLAEKPPADTFSAAEQLNIGVQNLPHVIGFNRRFMPIVERAKQNIPGQVTGYEFNMWRKDRKDRRFVFETGIHAINLSEFFFGPVMRAQIVRKWPVAQSAPSLLLKLTHADCEGFINFQALAGEAREQIRIYSTDKTLELFLHLPYVKDHPTSLRVFENGEWTNLTDLLEFRDEYDSYGFSGEYHHLIDMLSDVRGSLSGIESTLSCLKIAEWSDSAASGEIIEL